MALKFENTAKVGKPSKKVLEDAKRWAEETQMFQRIAKLPETSLDDLIKDYLKSRGYSQ